jgi:hypothetical protein
VSQNVFRIIMSGEAVLVQGGITYCCINIDHKSRLVLNIDRAMCDNRSDGRAPPALFIVENESQ